MTMHSAGGPIQGPPARVLVIPYADRGKPLPSGWDPLYVVRGDECILDTLYRCVRPDHPHHPAYVLQLPIPLSLFLSSNQRMNHWRHAERVQGLRQLAFATAHSTAKRKAMTAATCVAEFTWPDRKHRDAHNAQPTFKALMDGIVDAGLLPYDDDEHLTEVTFRSSTERRKVAGIACHVTLTFTPC